MEDGSNLPPWFMPLLDAKFYEPCPRHAHRPCNYFYWNVDTGFVLCDRCHTDRTHTCQIYFQVFKATEFPSVPRSQIGKFYDISDIQEYIINSQKVVYMNPRPRKGNGLENPRSEAVQCGPCGRELCRTTHPTPYRFCSIRCKLVSPPAPEIHPVAAERSAECQVNRPNGGGSIDDRCLLEDPRVGIGATSSNFRGATKSNRKPCKTSRPPLAPLSTASSSTSRQATESNGEPWRTSRAPMSACSGSYRKRSRKGVPRRSPLF